MTRDQDKHDYDMTRPDQGRMEASRSTVSPGCGSLSVYVHLPFCRVKCTYCEFAISTDLRLETTYVSALIAEIRARVPRDAVIETLYFGGGTPSRISQESVARIAATLAEYPLRSGAEVTLEANPEDVDRERLLQWRDELRVNRLSLGVQSFHDGELEPLGRQHGGTGARAAAELAASVIPRLSLDLILGLPHQTVESVASSMLTAVGTPARHISLYILDLEPGSALEKRVEAGLARLPADESTAAMYREVVRQATEAGMNQYEVSNFARPGEESTHNCRYWARERYVGVGIGAHSFDGRRRSSNTRSIHEYVEAIEQGRSPEDFSEELTAEDVRHERLFLGLRQGSGLATDEFQALAGPAADSWIDDGRSEGWLEPAEDRVRFTVDGFLLSDELIARLF